MKHEDSHLSDRQLLMDVDRELSLTEEKLVRAHLDACWTCRARRQELDRAIADFVRVQQREFDAELPRALLKARLSAALPDSQTVSFPLRRGFRWALAAAALVLLALGIELGRQSHRTRRVAIVSTPDSRLTPGATLLENRQAVCAQANLKNKAVSAAVQRKVFEEYGIAGNEPRAYEVDYLVTPALGGADDIHNLWPHSYSATVWNAQVKDVLEDRLREMVCDGNLDLTEAQQEIAGDWIAAYKKYFHTDRPLKGIAR